jgi:hypothetical protein
MKMNKVIDWLVANGRDPLEAILIPQPADIAEKIVAEERYRLNKALTREFNSWPPELRQHLATLIQERVDREVAASKNG